MTFDFFRFVRVSNYIHCKINVFRKCNVRTNAARGRSGKRNFEPNSKNENVKHHKKQKKQMSNISNSKKYVKYQTHFKTCQTSPQTKNHANTKKHRQHIFKQKRTQNHKTNQSNSKNTCILKNACQQSPQNKLFIYVHMFLICVACF